MQVFFESDTRVDLAPVHEFLAYMTHMASSPLAMVLVPRGLHPGWFRMRRIYAGCRAIWTRLVAETYARPMTDDDTAFWACLRRAFPDAKTDGEQYELAVANAALMYFAGFDTTSSGIAFALGALALDPASMRRLEEVIGCLLILRSVCVSGNLRSCSKPC